MIVFRLAMVASILPAAVLADVIMPARTIRANTVIAAEDLLVKSLSVAGTLERVQDVIGMEARVALYPGRPIRIGDIGPPAIVERNQIVPLVYRHAGLEITTEGRALGRGASGETVRVMNLASRGTVFGEIQSNGSVRVD